MSEITSILNEEPGFDLKPNRNDLIAEVLRIVGGQFGQIAASLVPDQRIERVIDFVEIWKDTIKNVQGEQITQNLKIDEAADLAEDAINLASRALTEERRKHIAEVLKNSLTRDEIGFDGKKKLMSIVAELSDTEIVLLSSMDLWATEEDEFYKRHNAIFEIEPATFGMSQDEYAGETMLEEYYGNLGRLNLATDTREPTRLGRLVLTYLSLDRESRVPGDF